MFEVASPVIDEFEVGPVDPPQAMLTSMISASGVAARIGEWVAHTTCAPDWPSWYIRATS
ncbi:MAG: hypothetical protein ACRDTE_16415 [Pseudonocardiaceae bacterium]